MPLEKSIDFENSIDYIFEYELGLQPKINLSKGENQKIDYWVIESKNKQITEHINSLIKVLRERIGNLKQKDTKEPLDKDNREIGDYRIDDQMPLENSENVLKIDQTEPILESIKEETEHISRNIA